MRDKYKYIGPVYDFLSNLYSGKNIHRCKTAMLDVETVKPGDRILFAGVGHGRDAIRAAELGAEVTVSICPRPCCANSPMPSIKKRLT